MTTTCSTADTLADQLGRRTGLRILEHHRGRVDRLLVERGLHGRTAVATLDHETVDALTDAVTTGETYFFRHPDQLAFLRSTILPRLLAERGRDHVVQFWSAGCASGEEPYTLAVLLGEAGLADRCEILGTELTAAALARAEHATYTPWSLRSPEAAARAQLFTESTGRRYRLSTSVTEQVRFARHNLLDPAYPTTAGGGFDVILCRNVLLHLAPAAIAEVSRRLVRALAPGGWLLTAPADPSVLDLVDPGELETVVLPTGGLAYRRPDGATASNAPPLVTRSASTVTRPEPTLIRRCEVPTTRDTHRSVRDGTTALDARSRCRQADAALADGRPDEAFTAAMSAAFLDPTLAAAHLTLGLAATRTDRPAVAVRAFRRATDLLAALPADEAVELCDGEPAGVLAELARSHLDLVGERSR